MLQQSFYGRWLLFICLALFQDALTAQSLRPAKLTCEYKTNPLGIDVRLPRFSWNVESNLRNQLQTAYEIEVSDDLKPFAGGSSLIWRTGKIASSQTLHVEYKGSPLSSFKRYHWRIRVYDQQDKASEWSDTAWFETAMLSESDWVARWIGDDKPVPVNEEDFYAADPMPVFRDVFDVNKRITQARLYITGLGYYEAYLNGKKVGDHVLDPGWTKYDRQVQYAVYDITGLLKKGKNVAGVMVGNGWYNVLPMRMWGRFNLRDALTTGRPVVKAQIRVSYADGTAETIITDRNWQMAPGPVIRNSVYRGEEFDARAIPDNWLTATHTLKSWQAAKEVEGPAGRVIAQIQEPVRITKILKPVSVTEVSPGVFVFDMGQNFAGAARIKVKGKAGTTVVLRYGEDILQDGRLNVMTSVTGQIKSGNGGPGAPRIAWQEDRYTLAGNGLEIWQPRFTFHGFRYIEVTGWPGKPTLNDIEGLRMNSDVAPVGSFSCSNGMFNKLDKITDWTFLSNIFSVQSDCPAREKFGYGGDIVATAEAYIYRYDMVNFYRKAIQDFENDQRSRGGITETAPYVGIADKSPGDQSGPPGWQLAFPLLIQHLYDFYGDRRVIEEHYDAVVKQVNFLRETAKNNLHFQDISDHEALDTKPESLTASAFYLHHVQLLANFARILGKEEDAQAYEKLSVRVKAAITAQFMVEGTGRFDNATQSAQLFALYYQLAPEAEKRKVFDQLLKEFERHGNHVSTGIFATKMMFDVLREWNRNDVAYTIAGQQSFPGWGYMVAQGATTLWETWAYSDNVYSQNHPMFGSVSEWFYRSLLGINSTAPGFEKIIIKPQPAGDLSAATGSYFSVRGKIAVEWKKEDHQFTLNVTLPSNTTAEVWVPAVSAAAVAESGKALSEAADVSVMREEKGYVVLKTGGGTYRFVSGDKK